jgi:hypothetical protein
MRLFLCSIFLVASLSAWGQAQPKDNSPYSRFGMGELSPQYFANQIAWGGQTAAFHDPFHLNIANPASFAFLRATALEVGLRAKYSHYASNGTSLNRWSGNLGYMALGFILKSPINEVLDKTKSPWKTGMGVSLTPYSQVGYQISSVDSSNQQVGIVNNTYQGNGGSYRLNWSTGVKYKNTAVGLNLGWLFGKATYENRNDFNSNFTYSYLNNDRSEVSLNGLLWNLGVQHDFVLSTYENDKDTPKKWITLGLTAESNHQLNVTNERLFIRSRRTTSDNQYVGADTLINNTNRNALKQDATLPGGFSLGFQLVDATKMRIGAQIGYNLWSNYSNEARPETLKNTFSTSAGIEYTPDFVSYNNYFKRIRYRAGLYYRQDPRVVNGNQLTDYGLTFGFGLPITLPRQQTSFVNLAFEAGQMGKNTTVEETYFRINVGFTLNDNTWFYKRRFE